MISLITATPFGAPGCGINKTKISKGMGQESMLGYKLNVNPGGGNKWKININNHKRTDYQGVLLFVTQISKPKVHLGEWGFKNQAKWKYQDVGKCSEQGVVTGDKGTVTHAVPDRVGLNVTFEWMGSDQEVAMEGLVVNAVVASLDKGEELIRLETAKQSRKHYDVTIILSFNYQERLVSHNGKSWNSLVSLPQSEPPTAPIQLKFLQSLSHLLLPLTQPFMIPSPLSNTLQLLANPHLKKPTPSKSDQVLATHPHSSKSPKAI